MDLTTDFDHVDPAFAYTRASWQLNYLLGLNLLSVPDREGAAGLKLVPEAATSMPKVSRDGRTYTFTVRRNLRFSDGKNVDAQSFKRAFERVAAVRSPGTRYMQDIAGAPAMIAGRAGSISGITVSGNRLAIKLAKPAPDFLARLAMPFFSAAAPNMPAREVGPPFPSAGPYTLKSWRPGRSAIVGRNPYYVGVRARSPDQIDYTLRVSPDQSLQRCERDEADVCSIPPAAAAGLGSKYGVNTGRFHVKPEPFLWYLALNHDRPLFRGNNKLKQAINHAIDRTQVAASMEQALGAYAVTRVDQIIPAPFPGFRNWNLYPLNGANVAKAKQLAQGSTRGAKVRLWTFSQTFGPSVAEVVKSNLRQIGVDTEISVLDRNTQLTQARRRGADYDAMLDGWVSEYPDPYDFLNVLLNGNNIRASDNTNLSYFNERKWNRRLDAASKLRAPKRFAAYALLDRDLIRGPAPIVPLAQPNARVFTSSRVGTYVFQPFYGTDFAALSLR